MQMWFMSGDPTCFPLPDGIGRKANRSYTKAYLWVYVVQKYILYMPILDHSKGKGRLLS